MSGTLVFKPLQAKLTHDTDTFSKMDPFCQIIIGSQTIKGKVCNSGGKNPQWSDSISAKRSGEPVAYLELKDKDTVSDDIIGVCQIDLNHVTGSSAMWYPLYYKQAPAGEILLEVHFTPDAGSHPSGGQPVHTGGVVQGGHAGGSHDQGSHGGHAGGSHHEKDHPHMDPKHKEKKHKEGKEKKEKKHKEGKEKKEKKHKEGGHSRSNSSGGSDSD